MRDNLQSLIDTFFCSVDIDKFYSQNQKEKLADWLRENGVIVPPCKVGDTLYRIDKRIKHCSLFHMYSKGNEYYCAKDYKCFLYNTPACDCGEEYYIYEIKTQNIETIICNMKGIGKTVFLTREAAEQTLKGGVQE